MKESATSVWRGREWVKLPKLGRQIAESCPGPASDTDRRRQELYNRLLNPWMHARTHHHTHHAHTLSPQICCSTLRKGLVACTYSYPTIDTVEVLRPPKPLVHYFIGVWPTSRNGLKYTSKISDIVRFRSLNLTSILWENGRIWKMVLNYNVIVTWISILHLFCKITLRYKAKCWVTKFVYR